MTSNQKKLYSVFARLFEEFKVSDQRCWLEIDRNKNGIAINFTHWHDCTTAITNGLLFMRTIQNRLKDLKTIWSKL